MQNDGLFPTNYMLVPMNDLLTLEITVGKEVRVVSIVALILKIESISFKVLSNYTPLPALPF